TTLADRSGELVTREELRLAVWGDETVVDFEHGLNTCIRQIRTALGEDAVSARIIETVPRLGYRFKAPVERVSATSLKARVPAAVLAVVTVGAGIALLALGPRPSAHKWPTNNPEAY